MLLFLQVLIHFTKFSTSGKHALAGMVVVLEVPCKQAKICLSRPPVNLRMIVGIENQCEKLIF